MRRIFLAILIIVGVFNLSAETITYIVNSRTSVRQEGDLIEGAIASFSQTSKSGTVGQMTTGNCTSFKLKNLPELAIRDLTLVMHSNASAGAGSLLVKRNNEIVAQIDNEKFSSPYWYGEYTNRDVKVKIDLDAQLLFQKGDSLSIDICASANSLYIVSYSIMYGKPNQVGYVVRLHTGVDDEVITLREQVPNQGVRLPNYDLSEDYRFIGWSEKPIDKLSYQPLLYAPYTQIYPVRNMAMYAVYLSMPTDNMWKQTTEFKSGDYLIADTWEHCVAQGILNPSSNIDARKVDSWVWSSDSLRCFVGRDFYGEEVYRVEFLSDTELTIKNISDAEYINPSTSSSSSSLSGSKSSTPWKYELLPYNQLSIYYEYSDGTKRYLLATETSGINDHGRLYFHTTKYANSKYGIILFNLDDIPIYSEPYYTSFPMMNFTDDVDNVSVSEVQVTSVGVINKTNFEIKLFTLAGVEVRRSGGDLSFEGLSSGVYILTTISGSQKVIVR